MAAQAVRQLQQHLYQAVLVVAAALQLLALLAHQGKEIMAERAQHLDQVVVVGRVLLVLAPALIQAVQAVLGYQIQ